MFDFIFDDDFPLYSADDLAYDDWLYGDSFPYSLYVYPREYSHWKPRLRHVTREGVHLQLCTYTYHVGSYYRGRLIAMAHFPCEVRGLVDQGGGRFYVDFPWGGAHIQVHFDHIDLIDGYSHGTEIAEEGFLPGEVIVWRERQARKEALRVIREARRARLAVIAKAALRRHKQRERALRLFTHIKTCLAPPRSGALSSGKKSTIHFEFSPSARGPPEGEVEEMQSTLNMMNPTKTALVRECKPADGPKICSRLHIRVMRRGPKGPQALPPRSGPPLHLNQLLKLK